MVSFRFLAIFLVDVIAMACLTDCAYKREKRANKRTIGDEKVLKLLGKRDEWDDQCEKGDPTFEEWGQTECCECNGNCPCFG